MYDVCTFWLAYEVTNNAQQNEGNVFALGGEASRTILTIHTVQCHSVQLCFFAVHWSASARDGMKADFTPICNPSTRCVCTYVQTTVIWNPLRKRGSNSF